MMQGKRRRMADAAPRTPNLPEDIWYHIHSLMPLRDAARVACVSRSFRCFWRCYPNFTFSREALRLGKCAFGKKRSREFRRKIDHIMRNHSGNGLRTFKLLSVPSSSPKDHRYVDKWLHMAVKSGTEELTLVPSSSEEYKFSLSLLSNGNGDSIRHLHLAHTSICPTDELCSLRSLTTLELTFVHITGDELWCLFSGSSALERFTLRYCNNTVCLKIPCHLRRLSHVMVQGCSKLQVIESKAPNLSSFKFEGELQVQISLGEELQVRNLRICCDDYACSTQAELASNMPSMEMTSSSMESSKLVDLKSVAIVLGEVRFGRSFNCPSLFSLFDASFTLESFISHVFDELMHHALVFGDPSELSMFNTSGGVSPEQKRQVEEACHMLRAWLS